MYVHAMFPTEKFTARALADLERSGAKVTATLSKNNMLVNEVATPLLHHWKDEV